MELSVSGTLANITYWSLAFLFVFLFLCFVFVFVFYIKCCFLYQ
jgi:hypothetical protein